MDFMKTVREGDDDIANRYLARRTPASEDVRLPRDDKDCPSIKHI